VSTDPATCPRSGATGDGAVPALLRGLVDDAAVFPPGNAPMPDALAAHAVHRAAWYAGMVGPFLVPQSALDQLAPDPPPAIGVIGDSGLAGAPAALQASDARWRQYEVAVAKRGEDPQPPLRELLAVIRGGPDLDVYAELPLTWGLIEGLDILAAERAAGTRVAPKFRTGGLAAELFPTPVELGAVICACRDRRLPFKLTAGLHHAVRHTDGETGFIHHGFLNVLAGCLAAADGAEVADVADLLGCTDPVRLVEAARVRQDSPRPLWVGFGSCSIPEPLADLIGLGLMKDEGGRQ
jgi:hypothetical protein